MEQLLKRFLWWIYMTRNKIASKWFSIKLNWLEFRYKGAENIPKEELSEADVQYIKENLNYNPEVSDGRSDQN